MRQSKQRRHAPRLRSPRPPWRTAACALGCGGRQRCRRRVRHEHGGKAPGARRHRKPHAKQGAAQYNSDLEVWGGWEFLEEDAVLRRGGVELRGDVVIRTDGGAQDSETPGQQVIVEAGKRVRDALRLRGKIDAIEQGPQRPAGLALRQCLESWREAKGERNRHERVPLLATIRLGDAVWHTRVISPNIGGSTGVEQAHKRQAMGRLRKSPNLFGPRRLVRLHVTLGLV